MRLAISDSLIADFNINDARAAMLIWIKKLIADLSMTVELSPRVFESTEEIMRRARASQVDAVALNVIEYRQLAALLDPSQVIVEADAVGAEQYVLLSRRSGGLSHVSQLRGKRLCTLSAPKMCLASAWLSTVLDPAGAGPAEQFFGSIATETKVSRVVLPVFFGQTDVCLTSKRGFDTMCEMNPQVAKELVSIASSPPLIVSFYVFHKNYHSPNRQRFVNLMSSLRTSVAGRQLATLFQFGDLIVRDAGCLTSSLEVLEAADRIQKRRSGGNRKG